MTFRGIPPCSAFEHPLTGYTNGIDSHLHLGASKFVTKQLQLGLVGYFYRQLTPDSGAAPIWARSSRRSQASARNSDIFFRSATCKDI
jgi:hypothetical protein